MSTPFSDLGLNDSLTRTVAERGYTDPTPIQAALIPSLLDGRDVVGQAQTGTGKTAAFALPMLHHLGEGTGELRGLVLCPTRELARQVAEAIHTYGEESGIRVLPIYGGQPYGRQIRRLKAGVDIVVGTPGRLLDLIRKGAIDLSQVHTAVLDEADEMLSMGFIDDIEAILDATPEYRQTAFFSATMSTGFERLAARHLYEPDTCRLEADERTAAAIEQRAYAVSKRNRLDALVRLLEVEDVDSAIVFARTRADTFALADALTKQGVSAGALNGEMDQPERQRMLRRFKNRDVTVLVGTNVAARGLDIDHISHVFNYELPRDPEVYVHRIGRTGRAGSTGTALSLVPSNQRGRLAQIERYTKQTIERAEIPSDDEVQAHRDAAFRKEIITWLGEHAEADSAQEREIVEALIEDGRSPVDIAAAALKAARSGLSPRNGSTNGPGHRRSNGASHGVTNGRAGAPAAARESHETGMVRLTLNTGRQSGTRPGQIVGTLAGGSDMPGSVIGKIDIRARHTTVDVPSEYVDQILAKSGSYKIGRRRVRVE